MARLGIERFSEKWGDGLSRNAAHYPDPTAAKALRRWERRLGRDARRAARAMAFTRGILSLLGYDLAGARLVDRRTGRAYGMGGEKDA